MTKVKFWSELLLSYIIKSFDTKETAEEFAEKTSGIIKEE